MSKLCAAGDPAQGLGAELSDAQRNANSGAKVASAEYAEPFFVPKLPVAAEFVANAAPRAGPPILDPRGPRALDHGRVTVEMSRQKFRDFPKNRPELSAIKSVDCSDMVRSARDLQKRCE
jgi:hypothetical protein